MLGPATIVASPWLLWGAVTRTSTDDKLSMAIQTTQNDNIAGCVLQLRHMPLVEMTSDIAALSIDCCLVLLWMFPFPSVKTLGCSPLYPTHGRCCRIRQWHRLYHRNQASSFDIEVRSIFPLLRGWIPYNDRIGALNQLTS